MDGAFLVLGVNIKGWAVAYAGDDFEELVAMAQTLMYYSVYRNVPGFSATSQKRFLVVHHNDPFWSLSDVDSGNPH